MTAALKTLKTQKTQKTPQSIGIAINMKTGEQTIGVGMKKCPSCSRISPENPEGRPTYKPLSDFYANSASCKECRRKIQKAYYERKKGTSDTIPPALKHLLPDSSSKSDDNGITVTLPDGKTIVMSQQEYLNYVGLKGQD